MCFHNFVKSVLGSVNPGDIRLIDSVLWTVAGPTYVVEVQANMRSALSPQYGLSAADCGFKSARAIFVRIAERKLQPAHSGVGLILCLQKRASLGQALRHGTKRKNTAAESAQLTKQVRSYFLRIRVC